MLANNSLENSFAGIIVGSTLPLSIAFRNCIWHSSGKRIDYCCSWRILISALGGSRVAIGGPTGAFICNHLRHRSTIWFKRIDDCYNYGGNYFNYFGSFRFGSTIKFIPHQIIVGFTSGIAVIIFHHKLKIFWFANGKCSIGIF